MKAVMYLRVSTLEQDYDRQFNELTELIKTEGNELVEVFEDKISGKVKNADRAGFQDLLTYLEDHHIKQIYVWEISRIGRTYKNSVDIAYELAEKGINIRTKKEAINTINSNGIDNFVRNILMAVAEYELTTIKDRTLSGTYNSIRNGGTGGGSIKQFGYKKENGKLVIDEEEKAVVLDIVDKYLNKDWSVKQIADYLNEAGTETRMMKLVKNEVINYTKKSKLLWTDGTVARLLHKRLLTGFRKYGKVELQDENFRIIDDTTFDALQLKMEQKRKNNANARKFENVLKGVLVCGNCGGSMIMQKGTSGLQNHYQCFNRFVKKSDCSAAMINIDLLNNTVYQLAKDFKVDSKDVANRIEELQTKLNLNNTSINQNQVEIKLLNTREETLVDQLLAGRIKPEMYDKKLNELNNELAALNERKVKLEAINLNLVEEINELSNQKVVDLSNPVVFKSNIKSLVESISVKNLNNADLVQVNQLLAREYDNVVLGGINRRNKFYRVEIKMFDRKTVYVRIFNNAKGFEKVVSVD